MSDKLPVADTSEKASVGVTTKSTSLLQDIVVMIRRDCAQETKQYLDETIVPHGGE